jgi:hypothetical protein
VAATVGHCAAGSAAVSFLAGALVGALIGVVVTVIVQPPLERWYASTRTRARRLARRSGHSIASGLERIGLFQILVWSAGRPLDASLHDVRFDPSERSHQRWFPEPVWVAARDMERAGVEGIVADVVNYSVDHGEAGPDSMRFNLWVRPSQYADAVAMQRLMKSNEHWISVEQLFRSIGTRKALECGPPQSLFVSLSLTSRDARCLALRRASAAVTTSGGLWALGACETMGPPPRKPGYSPESLFDLARRAALEELGLGKSDIGPIWFSWFGFSRCDGLLAVAHTTTHLTSDVVHDRILGAQGSYESDGIRWIDINSDELSMLAQPQVQKDWLGFTCIVARDHKRLWSILETEPRRL